MPLRSFMPDPPRRRPGARRPRPSFVLLLLLGLASPGQADECEGCPAPTLSMLQQQPGFSLGQRPWPLLDGQLVRDYYEVDAGECVGELSGPPHVTRLNSWTVLRGHGEVWNCPHSRSNDAITVETAQEDSSNWSVQGSVGLKLGDLVSAVTGEIAAGRTTGASIREVTRITKTIHAAWCHRIRWWGFFEVSAYKAEAEFTFKQRYAWWTKNVATKSAVHARGEIWVNCGTGTLELGRHAPIAGYFHLSQRGCADALCASVVPKHLGFFPPLPPYLPEPEGLPPASTVPATTTEPDEDEPPPPNPEGPPVASDGLGDAPSGPLPDPLAGGMDE